jgi:hypothetical protein
MIEAKMNYTAFRERVETDGAGVLNRHTLHFWAALMREWGYVQTDFVRKEDGLVWLASPSARYEDFNPGDRNVLPVDHGMLAFVEGDPIGLQLSALAEHRNVPAIERRFTELYLAHEFGEDGRLIT